MKYKVKAGFVLDYIYIHTTLDVDPIVIVLSKHFLTHESHYWLWSGKVPR